MIDKELIGPPGSPERALLDRLDLGRMPRHVAVIMDGNGRWAKQRRLPRVEGHRAGIASVRATVETAARLHLDALTLYAFSTENWKRPHLEVATLMTLLKEYVRRELATLLANDIRFRVIGRIDQLDSSVRKALQEALDATAHCKGLVFNIALSYSGRAELADAARRIAEEVAAGTLRPEDVGEDTLASRLYTAGLPDPDLLVRTSGEVRISNFLLWQIAYAEIYFTNTLWPDFRAMDFLEAIADFQKRERRFGLVTEPEPAVHRT
ncbi:MAG: isoprenyl transferase [Acidobacteria bacterium]|nr:isoprenyl transferase [Acidobacteriota bacterium]